MPQQPDRRRPISCEGPVSCPEPERESVVPAEGDLCVTLSPLTGEGWGEGEMPLSASWLLCSGGSWIPAFAGMTELRKGLRRREPTPRTCAVGARLSRFRRGTSVFLPHHYGKCVENPLPGSEPPAMRHHKIQQFPTLSAEITGPGCVDEALERSRGHPSAPHWQASHSVPFLSFQVPIQPSSPIKTVPSTTITQLRNEYIWARIVRILGNTFAARRSGGLLNVPERCPQHGPPLLLSANYPYATVVCERVSLPESSQRPVPPFLRVQGS